MSTELFQECEDIMNDYADRRTKESVERAERLRLGTWVPWVLYNGMKYFDMQTVELVVRNVNQWLNYLVGKDYAKRYHYHIREVGNTYQVYQDVERKEEEQNPYQGYPGADGENDPDAT